MIVGFVLVTGCVLKPTENGVPAAPQGTIPVTTIKNPVFGEHLQNLPFGELNVSIGNYDARLSVFVDDLDAGVVSSGDMLNLKIVEGNHSIRVCSGTVCESVLVNILSGVKTTVDFEERIKRVLPMGTLNVSIGNYYAVLPVYIDNSSVGNVSPNITLSKIISPGNHTVKICGYEDCYTEDVKITPFNKTTIDFGNRLISGINQSELMISIGGYDAQGLPVYIDNTSAGFISHGSLMRIKLDTGPHNVKVCSGMVCVDEQVLVQFAKPNYVDFGEELRQKAEFTKPVVRITDHTISGENLNINAEFINPSTKDLYMTATFSVQYTFINPHHERVGSSAQNQLTTYVRAGNRSTQSVSIWLYGGSDTIASDPVIKNMTTKEAE